MAVAILPETRLKLKSREISFASNLILSCQSFWKFCTEHGSITAVPCANFSKRLATEMGVMDERDFAIFRFKMRFERVLYIVTTPGSTTEHHNPSITARWTIHSYHDSATKFTSTKQKLNEMFSLNNN